MRRAPIGPTHRNKHGSGGFIFYRGGHTAETPYPEPYQRLTEATMADKDLAFAPVRFYTARSLRAGYAAHAAASRPSEQRNR